MWYFPSKSMYLLFILLSIQFTTLICSEIEGFERTVFKFNFICEVLHLCSVQFSGAVFSV